MAGVDPEIHAVIRPSNCGIIAELALALIREAPQNCCLPSSTATDKHAWALGEKLREIRRLLVEREYPVTQLLCPGGEGTTEDHRRGIVV